MPLLREEMSLYYMQITFPAKEIKFPAIQRTFFASSITWMSKRLCRNFVKTVFSEDDFPQNSVATPPAPALNSQVVNEATEGVEGKREGEGR